MGQQRTAAGSKTAGNAEAAESLEAAARRAEIVEAARGLFDEKGLAHTTVKDITEEVGVTRSLFYHYFPDKDAVVEAVLDSYIEDFRQMIDLWNEGRVRYDVRGSLHDGMKMLRRAVFDKDSFRHDLARQENAALYLRFSARTADVLAHYLTDTTAVEYAAFHELGIENVYETFYLLILGLIGFVRSKPDVSDEMLESLVAQTLRLDLDNKALKGKR